jgi:hypothetical protein
MPEYAALLDGSRELLRQQPALRTIRTEFTLPPSSDPRFLYQVLGGRIDGESPLVGVIKADGHTALERIAGR